DRASAQKVKTLEDYTAFAKMVDVHLSGMQMDLLRGQATTLLKQFHKEVQDWGSINQYDDKFNNVSYPLNGPYMTKGIGEDLDRELNAAKTASDYQQAIT